MRSRSPLARLGDAATLAGVAMFHWTLGAKFLWAPFGFDERYFLHEGWSLYKGLVPYRDFQEFKPPMIFFANALGIELFGLAGMSYRRIFSILSMCAFLSVTVALLSRRVSRILTCAVLALLIDHFFDASFHDSSINSAETLSLDFFLLGTGILFARTRWPRTQQFLGAALLALAPLSKEPLVFATTTAWVALLLLENIEKGRRAAVRFASFTIAGVASVLGTWIVYMLATHSLHWYVVQLQLSITYSQNYAYQMNWFPRTPEGGVAAESWRKLRAIYVNSAHLGLFVPLFLSPVFLWHRRFTAGAATLATMAAALYGVTIGLGFAAHYFIMAMAGSFFCIMVGAASLDSYAAQTGLPMRRWVAAGWVATAMLVTGARFIDEWAARRIYKPAAPPVSQAEIDFVRSHSAPSDRIWNLGDPLLYVYSDRLNAVREGIVLDELIGYYAGHTDEERLPGERAELVSSRPKLVIVGQDPVAYDRKQRYMRALVTPFLQEGGYVLIEDKYYVRP